MRKTLDRMVSLEQADANLLSAEWVVAKTVHEMRALLPEGTLLFIRLEAKTMATETTDIELLTNGAYRKIGHSKNDPLKETYFSTRGGFEFAVRDDFLQHPDLLDDLLDNMDQYVKSWTAI